MTFLKSNEKYTGNISSTNQQEAAMVLSKFIYSFVFTQAPGVHFRQYILAVEAERESEAAVMFGQFMDSQSYNAGRGKIISVDNLEEALLERADRKGDALRLVEGLIDDDKWIPKTLRILHIIKN